MATWIAHLRVAENILNKGFKHIKYVPDYLDYFPPKAFEVKVGYIKDYYIGNNEETKDNFIYLNEKEMDMFVNKASANIMDKLISIV